MYGISRLILIFTLILPFTHTIDADLDSGAMAEKLRELTKFALGKDEIQRLIDYETRLETDKILERPDKGELFAKQVGLFIAF